MERVQIVRPIKSITLLSFSQIEEAFDSFQTRSAFLLHWIIDAHRITIKTQIIIIESDHFAVDGKEIKSKR